MANVKITDLTAIAAVDLATNDVLPIVDVSVDQTKKVEISELRETVAYANDFVTYTQLNANIDAVQSNVQGFSSNTHTLTASANVLPGTNNTFTLGAPDAVFSEVYVGPNSLKLGTLTLSDTGGETLTITGASGSKGNLETAAVSGVANLTSNVVTLETDVNSLQSNTADLAAGIAGISVDTAAGTETRLNANLDVTNDNVTSLTTTVDNFGTSSNANATALAAGIASLSSVDTATGTETRLNANLDITNDNVTANFNQLDANINVVQDNVAANFIQLDANINVVQDNVSANFTQLDANINVVQDNVASNFNQLDANINVVQGNVTNITDGTTPFSAPVTFTDNVTISGSLIVTGAQVDLGVQTATVDNNFIELSAELGPSDAPATDSGLLINRGNKGNVFIGDHLGEDGVIFVRTQSPDTNTTIAIESFMDLHANMFHAAGPVDLNRVHFGLRAAEDTGIVIDESGANINFVIDGSVLANVHYDGTLNSQNAIIAPAVFSDGVELQANDSATLFSAYSNDFITYTQLNANLDVIQDNVATLTTTVDNFGSSSNSNAAALAAGIATLSSVDTATGTETRLNANLDITNDNVSSLTTTVDNFGTYANTNLDTKSNVSATFIQLNANISVVQDNVATLTTTVDNFGTYANTNFSTTSNAAELAAGIVGAAAPGFPTGDYGLLDAANSATDAFGETTADLDTFDMKTAPVGELATEDLGALT